MSSSAFTAAQADAIETLDRGLCVIASAGSGKTMVLVERYLRLIQKGLTPHQILNLTFTREAAEQLRRRILSRVEKPSALEQAVRSTPLIGTLHSYCLYLLRTHRPDGFAPREILDDVRWHECFNRVFETWFQSLESATLQQALQLWNVADIEAICKEVLRASTSDPSRTPARAETVAEAFWAHSLPTLYSLWQQTVLAAGLYSFSDLEDQALALLRTNSEVRKTVQGSLGAFLIDEFQDTSPAQWEILQHVIGKQWEKVFVVGDPRQSIYGFRNADVRLFFSAQDRIQSTGGKTIQLSTCFRSTPAVVATVNQLTQKLFGGSAFAAEEVLCGRQAIAGVPGLSVLPYACGGKLSAELSKAEIARVVEYLKQKLNEDRRPGDFALLFRNADRISDFAHALEAQAIPVTHRKGERLFDYYFSWDVLNFLKLVANPGDDFLFSAFLSSPFVGCPWTQLGQLCLGPGQSLYENATRELSSLKWFVELLERGETSPLKCLQSLFENTRYWPEKFPGWESLTKLLAESQTLWEAIQRLEICARNGVLGTTEAANARDNVSRGSISLLTIHAAKGLEFNEVLLVDLLRKQSHPNPWTLFDSERGRGFRYRQDGEITATQTYQELQAEKLQREKEEEKRLFYVAITRARNQITVSLPEDRSLCKKDSWASLF